MNDRKNQEAYYIEHYKRLGGSTSKWGLLFLLILIYAFHNYIKPDFDIFKSILTTKKQQLYFEKFKTQLEPSKLRKRANIKQKGYYEYRKIIETINTSPHKTIPQEESEYNSEYNSEILPFKKFEKLVRMDGLVQRYKKINHEYSSKTKLLKDGLKVSFDIPTIKSFEFNTRYGCVIWMSLLIVFIFYFFVTRIKMLSYLNQALKIYHEDIKIKKEEILKQYEEFDTQTPFWLAPVIFKEETKNENELVTNLMGWRNYELRKVTVYIFLFTLVSIQLIVAWLSWNINNSDILYEKWNPVFNLVTLILLGITFVLILLWLKPLKIDYSFEKVIDTHKIIGRRDFFKYSISIIGAVVSVYPINLITNNTFIPLIKPEKCDYRRKKKRKVDAVSLNKPEGFYRNTKNDEKNKDEKNKKVVIHYISSAGKCLSIKTIPKKKINTFKDNLQKIEINDILKNIKNYFIPFFEWSIEEYSLSLVKQKRFLEAFNLLIHGVEFEVNNDKDNKRLLYLFTGLLIRYKDKFKDAKEYDKFSERLSNMKENKDCSRVLNYLSNPKERFYKKWSNTKEIPWNRIQS